MARTRRQSARLRSTNPGRPPDPIPTGPPGAATHRAGPRSPLLPVADLSAPQRSAPGRREAWSACVDLAAAMASVVEYTRDSRSATTAATATPRRARRPAVSGPVDGAGADALRPNPRSTRRVRALAREHPGPALQLPLSFPTRFFPDRCPSRFVSWFHPHRRWRSFAEKERK